MLLSDMSAGRSPGRDRLARLRQPRGRAGHLFFCVTGSNSDGHDFAPQAIARGAGGARRRAPAGLGVPECSSVPARAAMAPVAVRFYGDPSAELRVVGVTGTNGKTTTAFLLRALLDGRRAASCGLLGTVKSVIGGVERCRSRSTHDARGDRPAGRLPRDARRRRPRLRDGGLLARPRARARRRDPLRRGDLHQPHADHLDFHADMEDYFRAKRRLFAAAPPAASVVTSATPTAGGWSRRRSTGAPVDVRARAATPTTGRAICAATSPGACRFALTRRAGATSRWRCRCRRASTSPTRSARSRPRTRSGATRRR